MNTALVRPGPHFFCCKGDNGRQQARHCFDGQAQRADGAGAPSALAGIGALFDKLQVVIGESPEERFRHFQRSSVIKSVISGSRALDHLAKLADHVEIQCFCNGSGLTLEPINKLGGVEHLDGKPATDLDLLGVLGVECRVGAKS